MAGIAIKRETAEERISILIESHFRKGDPGPPGDVR